MDSNGRMIDGEMDHGYKTIDGLVCELCIDEYIADKKRQRDLKELGVSCE